MIESPPDIIFLCYVNRSGSTFLANLFSKSPNICVCPEAEILVDLLLIHPTYLINPKQRKKVLKALQNDQKLLQWGINEFADLTISAGTNFDCFKAILNQYKKLTKPAAKTIVFKAERLIHLYKIYAPDLNLRFNLSWINIIRDSRSVYLSQKRSINPDTKLYFTSDLVHTINYWKSSVNKAIQINDALINIFYEKLIANNGPYFLEIINKLKLEPFDYQTCSGDLLNRLPENHKILHADIENPPLIDNIDKWIYYLSDEEIYSIQFLSGELLLKFGYKIIDIKKKFHLLRLKLETKTYFNHFCQFSKKTAYKALMLVQK